MHISKKLSLPLGCWTYASSWIGASWKSPDRLLHNESERFSAVEYTRTGPNTPNSRSEFSTCTDEDIVTSCRLQTSFCRLEENSMAITAWSSWPSWSHGMIWKMTMQAQFCNGFGAQAKPFRMALGALIIKTRMGLTDEELVEHIRENPYLQFFIGLKAFQYSAPFDPSMMVYFRKRLPESVVNDCNERIMLHGLSVIRSAATDQQLWSASWSASRLFSIIVKLEVSLTVLLASAKLISGRLFVARRDATLSLVP